jgi:hypothetical protein
LEPVVFIYVSEVIPCLPWQIIVFGVCKVWMVVASVVPGGGNKGIFLVSLIARLQVVQASIDIPLHGVQLLWFVSAQFGGRDLDLHQSNFPVRANLDFVSV